MLEEESLVTEQARVQVCCQINGRDVHPFATIDTVGRSQSLNGKQTRTTRDGLELVVPVAVTSIIREHALEGLVSLKRKGVGDADIFGWNGGAVCEVLENIENTAAKGPFLALEELLLDSHSFAGVRVLEWRHTRQHWFLEEVPAGGADEAGHGNDVIRFDSIAKELEGDRRLETL